MEFAFFGALTSVGALFVFWSTDAGGKMKDYSETTKQDNEDKNEKDLLEDKHKNDLELFKPALKEVMNSKYPGFEEKIKILMDKKANK